MGVEPGYGETPVDPEEADALTPQAREILGDAPKKIDLYEAEQTINDEVSIAFLEQRACSPTWCSSPRKTRRRSQRPYDWDIDKRRYIALLREYDLTRDPQPLAAFVPVQRLDDGENP